VTLLNVLLWRAFTGTARRRSTLAALLLVLVPWLWGRQVLRAGERAASPPVAARTVALVQGNVAGEIKWSGKHQAEILRTFLDLSAQAAARRPRPIVAIWPETATGSYLRKQLDQALAVAAFAARSGVPVFTGYADYAWDAQGHPQSFNSAGLFAPDGRLGPAYAKRHLVPFGERMPFQRLFPWLGRLELGQAEWTPGRRSVLFPSAAGAFACLVCFEAIFPDLARDDVRAGARWLVNVTNDEWFGNGAALHQHADMSVLRAVENGVPLARCANTGLTLVADAYGRVTATLPVFQPGVLVTELPPPAASRTPTLYTRLGDWPGWMSLLALAGLVARAAARSR
jgi:apolipoprotein N-acyltransferase